MSDQPFPNRRFHQTRAQLLLQLALIWRDKQEARGFAALAAEHLDRTGDSREADALDRIASPPLAPA
jgi:hypothetical protein